MCYIVWVGGVRMGWVKTYQNRYRKHCIDVYDVWLVDMRQPLGLLVPLVLTLPTAWFSSLPHTHQQKLSKFFNMLRHYSYTIYTVCLHDYLCIPFHCFETNFCRCCLLQRQFLLPCECVRQCKVWRSCLLCK